MKKRKVSSSCKSCVGVQSHCKANEEMFLNRLKKNLSKMTKEQRLKYLMSKDLNSNPTHSPEFISGVSRA